MITMMTRLKILCLSLLLCAPCREAPCANITGPDSIQPCQGLIRLTAEPSHGGQLAWLVFPASLDHHVDGNLLLFAAPAKPQQLDFAVIEVTQEPFAIHTAQHSIAFDGTTPAPEPQPPDQPAELSKEIARLLNDIPVEYVQYRTALSTNFSRVAADQSLTTVDAINDALQKLNREVLDVGPLRDAWSPFFGGIATFITETATGPPTVESQRDLLRKISSAIQTAKVLR